MSGACKLRRIKHFSAGKRAFFAYEVAPFHPIEGQIAHGALNGKWCKNFGHGIKLLNTNKRKMPGKVILIFVKPCRNR